MKLSFLNGSFLCVVGLVFATGAASAQNIETNEMLKAESNEWLPTLEAGLSYHTMKIERGLVENDESMFGYEVELNWLGLVGGVEACYDMTNVNGRRGRYNEIESFLGYEFTYQDFTAKIAYIYKAIGESEEKDTQEIEFELAYETPWVTPFVMGNFDVKEADGAFYGRIGVAREWDVVDGLTLGITADVGMGDDKRNEADFDSDKWAFREMHLGLELAFEICPHVKLVPTLDFYDYFTSSQRHAWDKCKGFVPVAGCSLAIEF